MSVLRSGLNPGCPETTEYPSAVAHYIALAHDEDDILSALRRGVEEVAAFASAWDEERARTWRYAPGKWTLCEVLGHLADSERVFSYRALRIARGDKTPLAPFDQDLFAANAPYADADVESLIEELRHLRAATVALYSRLNEEAWMRRGTSSGFPNYTTRAFAYLTVGHERHHLRVLRERYLPD
jgi:hypothetical protein